MQSLSVRSNYHFYAVFLSTLQCILFSPKVHFSIKTVKKQISFKFKIAKEAYI